MPSKSRLDGTRICINIKYTIFGSGAPPHFGRKALWAARIVGGTLTECSDRDKTTAIRSAVADLP